MRRVSEVHRFENMVVCGRIADTAAVKAVAMQALEGLALPEAALLRMPRRVPEFLSTGPLRFAAEFGDAAVADLLLDVDAFRLAAQAAADEAAP